MNKNKKVLIFVIILILSIGFAVITVNLNINGNVYVKGNASNFNVIYDTTYYSGKGSAYINGLSYDTADPSYTSNTQMVYNPNKGLIVVGDYYEVEYKLINTSTLYAARVNINCGTGSDGSGSLSPFNLSGDVNSIFIDPNGSYEGKLRIDYVTTVEENTDVSFSCKVNAYAVSTDVDGNYKKNIVLANNEVAAGVTYSGVASVGNTITYNGKEYIVLSNDGTSIRAIGKESLGQTVFTSSVYWNTANVNLTLDKSNNTSIYNLLENFATANSLPIESVTIPTKDEADSLGESIAITSSYWTRTTADDAHMYRYSGGSNVSICSAPTIHTYNVLPVIILAA